ncbi:MAG TPA: sugar phosphate nucleotidyltransferase [Candidatus Dormibacteraeota bacterium]
MSSTFAVIPAGGAGTRLWPWSNQSRPKHLLDLTGSGRSLLQETYDRIAPLADAVYILTEERQVPMIKEQLPDARFIVEPTARGTANALGLAAFEIAADDPQAVMVSVAADHVIQGAGAYRDSIEAAVRVAESGDRLVTIGLQPTYAATGFGYIRVGEREGEAYRVAEFVEKPTLVRAKEYLASGRYYWNLSMFAWRAGAFLAELEKVAPRHHAGLLQVRAGELPYAELPNEAVDYAVLERTDRLYLVPGTFEWLDVGSWAELLDLLPGDENGNSIDGESAVIDTHGSLISAPGKLIAAIGIEDLIVVDTDQALLILPRSRAQDVKKIVEMLRRTGKTGYL